MVSVTDSDYADATTRTNSAFVISNFYIPVNTSASVTTNNPSFPVSPGEIDLTGAAGMADLFTGGNALEIADAATPTVDVGIRVAYGVLSSTDAVHTGVQVIQAPPANGNQTGVDDGTDWVAGWM